MGRSRKNIICGLLLASRSLDPDPWDEGDLLMDGVVFSSLVSFHVAT